MHPEPLSEADIERVRRIWAEYQRTHDISAYDGQTAAVDMVTGEVVFGPSAYQIWTRVREPGRTGRLFVIRMNSADYRFMNRLRYGRPRKVVVEKPPAVPADLCADEPFVVHSERGT
jgi:hypothetical protein